MSHLGQKVSPCSLCDAWSLADTWTFWCAGPAIYHFQQVEAEGAVFWLPLLLFIGVCESYRVGLGWAEPRSTNFYSLRDDYEPGNLGFDPFGLLPEDPKERKDMQVGNCSSGMCQSVALSFSRCRFSSWESSMACTLCLLTISVIFTWIKRWLLTLVSPAALYLEACTAANEMLYSWHSCAALSEERGHVPCGVLIAVRDFSAVLTQFSPCYSQGS